MIKYSNKKFVEAQDWDNLVTETYKKPYIFQQQGGCKDRGVYELTIPSKCDDSNMPDTVKEEVNGRNMGVNFKAWLARDPEEWNGIKDNKRWVNIWWERNFYPDVQMIANDLYSKGLIEAGEYVINIDW